MGQSHSRNRPSSRDSSAGERPLAAPQPSSSHIDDQTERDAPLPSASRSRSRRYSTNLTNFVRRRSSPDLDTQPPTDRDGEVTRATSRSPLPLRRRSRLSRAGSSFTNTIPSIFVRNASPSRSRDHHHTVPSTSSFRSMSRTNTNSSLSSGLPRLQMPDLDSSLNLPSSFTPVSTSHPEFGQEQERRPGSLADRISSLTPDRGFRNRTATLRRRRSPLSRPEDQGAMLSRLLSVVAAATAATLMGAVPETNLSELRDTANPGAGDVEGDDGTFNGFLQALRSGRLTSTSGQQPGEGSAADNQEAGTENSAPLEFFRMFRFGNSNNPRRRQGESSRPSSRQSSANDLQGESRSGETREHRMVPILIVGIRALNETDHGQENNDGVPNFLEALTNGPANFNLSMADNTETDGAQQTRDGVRFSQRRRASFGSLNFFSSSGREAMRNARSSNNRARSEARISMSPTPAADSPPGPYPPPTTPASPPVSAFSSGASTPTSRSTYSSTAAQLGVSPRRDSFIRRMNGTALESTAEETASSASSASSSWTPATSRPPRQRRVSDSDSPRFGSGSSRRNGVLVEPPPEAGEGSGSSDGSNGSGGNRSWVIYILGGSYPENHPILSTPSLFTDSPTYEDMMLLSSLLGPAKPPVANADDVAAAPGLFRIRHTENGSIVTAVPVRGGEGSDDTILAEGERCLVCLCDYADGEEARKLIKCGHFFHRECIDQWLTTGRNSCPLCRGEGVHEKDKEKEKEKEKEAAASANATADARGTAHAIA